MTGKIARLCTLVSTLALGGCSDENDALSALHSAGWSNAQVTDTSYLNLTCGRGEMAYQISGKNPAGKKASATVCCGYTTALKGCTIRY